MPPPMCTLVAIVRLQQVQGYLRFAKMKRDQHLREVNAVFSDFSEYRVRDSEVYTTKEVKELLADLREDVNQRVDNELENASFASGLLLQLLFQQAEMADLYIEADINELENEHLLKQVRFPPLTHASLRLYPHNQMHWQRCSRSIFACLACSRRSPSLLRRP